MTRAGRPVVAVVGGGIAGLAAAWELTGGVTGPGDEAPSVVLFESSPRPGGKLATAELSGGTVDVGPDGVLGRRPEAVGLCREVGLGDDLVPVGAAGAAVWARGRRRPLPEGLLLGVPTRLVPTARSGILTVGGTLRLSLDLVAPRPDARGPLGDRAIGPLVARKLGQQVVDRFVDPLVGGIHAGGVADASAAAVFPALLTVAQGRTSFMRSLGRVARHASGPDGEPLFWALRRGFGSLVDRLADRLAERRVELCVSRAVETIARTGRGWALGIRGAGEAVVDGVVLSTPAGPAAALLEPHDAEAAGILRTLDYASVAVVTLAYPAVALGDDLFGTGLLVPHGTPLPRGLEVEAAPGGKRRETFVVTACTYLWAKWPHLGRPAVRLVRASVGHAGDTRHREMSDDALVRRVVQELSVLVGATGEPSGAMVTRWDDALPQYRVHHLLRVSSVEAAVRRLGGVVVAGAAYHGVGVPACIGSGRAAAAALAAELSRQRSATTT